MLDACAGKDRSVATPSRDRSPAAVDLFERCTRVRCRPVAKLVLMVLALDVDERGAVRSSVATISHQSGYSLRAVQRGIQELERDGHLTRFHSRGRGAFTELHPRIGDA